MSIKNLLSEDEFAEVTSKNNWLGASIILFDWIIVAGSLFLAAAFPNPAIARKPTPADQKNILGSWIRFDIVGDCDGGNILRRFSKQYRASVFIHWPGGWQ